MVLGHQGATQLQFGSNSFNIGLQDAARIHDFSNPSFNIDCNPCMGNCIHDILVRMAPWNEKDFIIMWVQPKKKFLSGDFVSQLVKLHYNCLSKGILANNLIFCLPYQIPNESKYNLKILRANRMAKLRFSRLYPAPGLVDIHEWFPNPLDILFDESEENFEPFRYSWQFMCNVKSMIQAQVNYAIGQTMFKKLGEITLD